MTKKIKNRKSVQNHNKNSLGEYISWGLTILLILTILYAKFGGHAFCNCPPIDVIEVCNGVAQNLPNNLTINLTGVLG